MWEPSEMTKEKVLTAISHTISGTDHDNRMEQARRIPIKDVVQIGKYVPMRTRPVMVKFYHKTDAEFLLSNRTHLPQGVYIDHQYSDETEKARRKLRPILKAARNHENYKGNCKTEGPNLIIKGRKYNSTNLHLLPNDINSYQATSKVDQEENVLRFLWRVKPTKQLSSCSV